LIKAAANLQGVTTKQKTNLTFCRRPARLVRAVVASNATFTGCTALAVVAAAFLQL